MPARRPALAVHVYRANRSMKERYFWNADGELMFVPQQGALVLFTELGQLEVEPGEIAVVPRGMKFQVARRWPVARLRVRELRRAFPPARARPDRLAGSRADARLPGAGGGVRGRAGKCEVVAKFMGGLWAAELAHSPLDVVAWHGDYVPYKYDLARFMAIGTISFDHPDPSLFTVLTSPSGAAGRRELRLRHLPAALAGRREHLPPAVVPPQRDERADGPGARRVRREGRGLPARRRVDPQLHVARTARTSRPTRRRAQRSSSRRRSRTRSPSCGSRATCSGRRSSR